MSKLIKLTNEEKTLVDNKDFYRFGKMGWHKDGHGYVYRKFYLGKINGKDRYKNLFLHRIILNAKEGKEVDHENGNKLDNRRKNLRICTHAENMANMKKPKNNTSGYKGVYFQTHGKLLKRWVANIRSRGKRITGRFYTKEEAAKFYNIMAIRMHGEFARLNKI